jgi:DNA polymerase-3 subunit delta
MAKSKINVPPLTEAVRGLKKGELLPMYLFFGEDSYSIENCVKLVEEKAASFITNDFDKEIFYGEDKTILDIIDFASSFPFGSEKKLIIVKEFEKTKDKKNLLSYAKSPADFSILVLINNGSISNLDSEPFKTLINNGFVFEAKELKGGNLIEWLISFAKENGKVLTPENAQMLVDISGEDRTILNSQLEKIFTFMGENKEVSLELIRSLSTALKEYNIFDLQSALGKKDKAQSLKIAYSLIDQGAEPSFIIHMLTRYFTALARIRELQGKKLPDQVAAKIVGTIPYYYKDYINARNLYSDKELYRAVQSLLKADVSIKTTSAENKSIIALLIAEIFN